MQPWPRPVERVANRRRHIFSAQEIDAKHGMALLEFREFLRCFSKALSIKQITKLTKQGFIYLFRRND